MLRQSIVHVFELFCQLSYQKVRKSEVTDSYLYLFHWWIVNSLMPEVTWGLQYTFMSWLLDISSGQLFGCTAADDVCALDFFPYNPGREWAEEGGFLHAQVLSHCVFKL